MTTLALLHTSPVHKPVFDALRDDEAPGLVLRHLVHAQLLDDARESGPDAVAGAVRAVLADAVAQGADAVLCTCSTIGAVAEAASDSLGVPVLRVDRPMAAAAVALGRRIAVVAAVESTLGPTVALIREEDAVRAARESAAREAGAVRAGGAGGEDANREPGAIGSPATGGAGSEDTIREPGAGSPAPHTAPPAPPLALRTVLADGAWAHFEAGDTEAYRAAIVRTVDALCDVDVVVLAQASMASAAARTTTGVPVLASPRLGLRAAAVAAAEASRLDLRAAAAAAGATRTG